MARMSLEVGVPIFLIISTSWSTALLPGKIGSQRIVSAITQAKNIIIGDFRRGLICLGKRKFKE